MRLVPGDRRCGPSSGILFRFAGQLWLGLLPQWSVGLLVEGGTSGGELAERVVLGPHQVGAVAECTADLLAIELTGFGQCPGEIGV